jgi:hypothetical protein
LMSSAERRGNKSVHPCSGKDGCRLQRLFDHV